MVNRSHLAAGLIALLMAAGCSSPQASPVVDSTVATTPVSGDRPIITVQASDGGKPLDPRLFGTNVPAWVNPGNLGDARIRAATVALGTPIIRIPGGSWSNAYNWLACETGDSNGCSSTWASRPTDFLNFMRATGTKGMWTVSFNGTSKEAAAIVAFFNGAVSDTTLIGVDVKGRDWKRVGDWAALRARNGNPEPLPITLWEVGNEIYGAKQAAGPNCASWGWEDVWTCDGNEYMLGKGSGASRREGYLEFRAAMRAVDPTIQVGAVGVPHPGDWSDWGTKVIQKGGANLDFYVIHMYGVDAQPASAAAILPIPQRLWKGILGSTNAAFDQIGARGRVPIAITEYNLAAFQDLDNAQLMTRAVNALFIADMIGQLAVNGATMANQWNLANGRAGNGTDYGLIEVAGATRAPQYYALKLWTTLGTTLLPVTSALDDSTTLSTYATRAADGTIAVLAINKTGRKLDVRVALAGESRTWHVSADVLRADSLEATSVRYNGVSNPAANLSDAPAKALGDAPNGIDVTLDPYSVTVLRFKP